METFGEGSEPENRQPPKMVVPPRALNYIEIELQGQLDSELGSAPNPPFIDGESGDIEGDDYDGMSLRTALDLRNLILLDIGEKLRRQLVIARELGPIRTDGGPFTSEYEIACQLEGVEPWPLGNRVIHEPQTRSK